MLPRVLPVLDPFPDVDTAPALEPIVTVLGWLMWCGGVIAVVSFMVAGVLVMVANHTGQSNEAWRYVVHVGLGASVVSAASYIATAVAAAM